MDTIDLPVADWRDFIPLAKAETSKFYRRQDRGRFRYDELLNVAVLALVTAKPSAKWARKAIKGALTDYVRDERKAVRNVEMSEARYLRAYGEKEPKRVCRIIDRYVDRKTGAPVTVYTPGPYRTNAQLLTDYKVGRHGKVSVKLVRTSYEDGWSQSASGCGWIRAKIDNDEPTHDHRAASVLQRGEVDQRAYVGEGREKRFSSADGYDNGTVEIRRSQTGKFRAYSPPFLMAKPSRRRAGFVPAAGCITRAVRPVPVLRKKIGPTACAAIQEAWLIQAARGPSWCRSAGDFRIAPGLPDIPAGATWTLLTKTTDGELLWYCEKNLILNLTGRVSVWADIFIRERKSLPSVLRRRFGVMPVAGGAFPIPAGSMFV